MHKWHQICKLLFLGFGASRDLQKTDKIGKPKNHKIENTGNNKCNSRKNRSRHSNWLAKSMQASFNMSTRRYRNLLMQRSRVRMRVSAPGSMMWWWTKRKNHSWSYKGHCNRVKPLKDERLSSGTLRTKMMIKSNCQAKRSTYLRINFTIPSMKLKLNLCLTLHHVRISQINSSFLRFSKNFTKALDYNMSHYKHLNLPRYWANLTTGRLAQTCLIEAYHADRCGLGLQQPYKIESWIKFPLI